MGNILNCFEKAATAISAPSGNYSILHVSAVKSPATTAVTAGFSDCVAFGTLHMRADKYRRLSATAVFTAWQLNLFGGLFRCRHGIEQVSARPVAIRLHLRS